MVGERCRQVVRTVDDRIVGVRRPIRNGGVDQVGEPEQQLAQLLRRDGVLLGEALLDGAQLAALRLAGRRGVGITGAAEGADLLGQ